MPDEITYVMAGIKLQTVRAAIDVYNKFAMENGLYAIGLDPAMHMQADLDAAESSVSASLRRDSLSRDLARAIFGRARDDR